MTTLTDSSHWLIGAAKLLRPDIDVPAGLAEVVAGSKLEYQLKGEAYVLDWRLVPWQAVLDGRTGKLQVTAASAAP